MAGQRVVQTWYRCILEKDDSIWCETSSQSEVLFQAQSADGPVRFETFSVVQYDTPWTAWEPASDALAEAKQDYAAMEDDEDDDVA